MRLFTFSIFTLTALLLSSCNALQKSQTTTSTKSSKNKRTETKHNSQSSSATITTMPISDEDINGEWTIIEVNGEKTTGDERPYIYFNISDNRFYGSNGCNIINGDFKISGTALKTENIIATQKACHDAEYEYQINYALSQVSSYTVQKQGNEDYLSLYDTNSTKILVLRKHNMDYLNGTWSVIKINNTVCNDKNIKFVIDIPEQKLHGNTGCNIVNGQLFIDPDKENSIQFHQLMSTRMACPNQSQETALLVALEEVESAKKNNDQTISLLNKKGTEILILKKE